MSAVSSMPTAHFRKVLEPVSKHICLNTPIWSWPKHDLLWEMIHTGLWKNAGLTRRCTQRQDLQYVGPLWAGNFCSLADSQLWQQWRGLLNQLLQKQHQADCSSAFVSPRLRARDENGSVKQLVTCLSKKNVKRHTQKQIRASVVLTLTQFLALLRARCAFGYANDQREAEIVSSLKMS